MQHANMPQQEGVQAPPSIQHIRAAPCCMLHNNPCMCVADCSGVCTDGHDLGRQARLVRQAAKGLDARRVLPHAQRQRQHLHAQVDSKPSLVPNPRDLLGCAAARPAPAAASACAGYLLGCVEHKQPLATMAACVAAPLSSPAQARNGRRQASKARLRHQSVQGAREMTTSSCTDSSFGSSRCELRQAETVNAGVRKTGRAARQAAAARLP